MFNKIEKINLIFLIAVIIIILVNAVIYIVYKDVDVNNDEINKESNIIHIVIDPGHGGMDSGAVNPFGENEAPINLEISKCLMTFLDTTGFEVDMTRYDNKGLYTEGSNTTIREKKNEDLRKRIEMINASKADLVISVHLNSFTQNQYYGAQTFYKRNCEESKLAAEIMQKNLRNILDKDNDRVPQSKRDVKVIDNSNIPIVLVECGFVSNEQEARLLCTPEYQEKVAWAIYSGIVEYFEKVNSENKPNEAKEGKKDK